MLIKDALLIVFKQLLLFFYWNPHIHWSIERIQSVSSLSVFQNLASTEEKACKIYLPTLAMATEQFELLKVLLKLL